eukprot:TRINITY_DN29558_c0_g1_i1.p1 TRINITY_DN29558_c0_g1~~TRINITY_DN29558_c0_g1_i1.p1  ORF type:complete len:639 (-),score=145.59 TRINITY_DN29558_c0_g1_i1:322-2238(-)
MSSVDPSGVATVLFLLGAGPAYFGTQSLLKARRERREEAAANDADTSAAKDTKEDIVEVELEDEQRGPMHMVRSWSLLSVREEQGSTGYLLGLLGYAIGIGNLWRFPYLVGKYGGGAFVFAYLCCLVMIAIPLYLMELVMGQYTRRNTIGCFNMIHPRWVGLGWGQAICLFFALSYYNVLLAYSCIYIASSMFSPLLWAEDSTAYWRDSILNAVQEGEDQPGLGAIQWHLVAALFVVWLMVFFALAFGKKILEKVTWVTVVGPIVLLIVLLVRTAFLPGAAEGVAFYIFKFDAAQLADPEVWAIACGQILFSLSPGFGTAITMSSFTKKTEDVYRVCLTVAFSNSLFSLTGGFAIFGILGNLAHKTGKSVEEVASTSGPGLAFIAIAEAMSTLGAAGNVFSVLFFTMLLSLGLDSTFAWADTFVAYIADYLRERRCKVALWKTVGVTCLVLFVCGLPYCTRRGNQLLDIIDHYVASYFLLFGCSLECIMFGRFFGFRRLVVAIKRATLGSPDTPEGRNIFMPCFWRVCLHFFVPVATIVLLLQLIKTDIEQMYGNYPIGLQIVGWTAIALCVGAVPLTWCRSGGSSLVAMPVEESRLQFELKQHNKAKENDIMDIEAKKEEMAESEDSSQMNVNVCAI